MKFNVVVKKKGHKRCKKVLHTMAEEFLKRWNNIKLKDTARFQDFTCLQTLGVGGFGKVLLVQHKRDRKFHAMKVLSKKILVDKAQVMKAHNEKRVLLSINFPFLVYMDYFFKNNSYVYFVLPFVSGGDMFGLIQSKGKFDEKLAMFYAAQVTLALEYLHHCKLVYRDLKPENVMIDRTGYLKITDFGFCKRLDKGRTWTLCGTPEYLAPEIIKCKEYGFAVDWWSFGVLVYEMNSGYSPFNIPDPMQLYYKIVRCKYQFPIYFKDELKDLIQNLLQLDLTKRYGNLRNGINDIKCHKWFQHVNWRQMYEKKIVPPYMPNVDYDGDTKYFTDRFSDEPMIISAKNEYVNEFKDF